MFGQPRSRANTKEFNANYEKVDWKDGADPAPAKQRGIKPKSGGGWDCGIRSHDHDAFADALGCVQKK